MKTILMVLILVLLLAGCAEKKIEDKIDTFDELKQAKSSDQPTSEFDKCNKQFEAEDKKINDCSLAELKAQGFTDNDACAQDSKCQVAESEAYNRCIEMYPRTIGLIDCMQLIPK